VHDWHLSLPSPPREGGTGSFMVSVRRKWSREQIVGGPAVPVTLIDLINSI
jgi:hypothetical protein